MSDHLIGIIDKTQFETDILDIKVGLVSLAKEILEIKALLLDLKAFEEMNKEL